MPVGIYEPLRELKGLPSDEQISEWCKRLRLCIDAINAEENYDAHTSGYADEEEMYQGLSHYDEQRTLYQNAINALTALLPEADCPVCGHHASRPLGDYEDPAYLTGKTPHWNRYRKCANCGTIYDPEATHDHT